MDLDTRIQSALASLSAESTTIEFRDADPNIPDQNWRKAALGFVATVMMATASSAVLVRNSMAGPIDHVHQANSASIDEKLNHGTIEIDVQYAKDDPTGDKPPVTTLVRSNIPQPKITPSSSFGGDFKKRMVTIIMDGKSIKTIAPMDRVRLCKVVAAEQNLKASGLDWKDLYGLIHAETGWVPRDGLGRNGQISRGLAQIEDDTAESLGIDPHNPKQALEGVAALLKDAVKWSQNKGHAATGSALSVYYNLSTRARNKWDGRSVHTLPIETQRHIANVSQGRLFATQLGLAWDEQHKHLLKRTDISRITRIAEGDGLNQRMKGLVASVMQQQPLADVNTAAGRQSLKARTLSADRAGIRMNHVGLDQFRSNVLNLIDRIKQRSGSPTPGVNQQPDPGKPGFAQDKDKKEGRLYDFASSASSLVQMLGLGVVSDLHLRTWKGDKHKSDKLTPAQREEAIASLAEQEGATVKELHSLSDRNLAFAGYFEKLADQQQALSENNQLRERRG